MNKLAYYVFVENFNTHKIERYNVLNDGVVKEIKEKIKGISDKKEFSEIVKRVLMYYYWCRAEWEIVLTSWPTYVAIDEVNKFTEQITAYKSKFKDLPLRLTINLTTEEKIDVYSQVELNWEIFIDYLWKELM